MYVYLVAQSWADAHTHYENSLLGFPFVAIICLTRREFAEGRILCRYSVSTFCPINNGIDLLSFSDCSVNQLRRETIGFLCRSVAYACA